MCPLLYLCIRLRCCHRCYLLLLKSVSTVLYRVYLSSMYCRMHVTEPQAEQNHKLKYVLGRADRIGKQTSKTCIQQIRRTLMELPPHEAEPIPEATRRLIQKACPKGTPATRLRDALGPIYHDEAFADLFPKRGRPAEAPWR